MQYLYGPTRTRARSTQKEFMCISKATTLRYYHPSLPVAHERSRVDFLLKTTRQIDGYKMFLEIFVICCFIRRNIAWS